MTALTFGSGNERIDVYMPGHVEIADVFDISVDCLISTLRQWDMREIGSNLLQIAGVGYIRETELFISLTHHTDQSVLQALDKIETEEGNFVPISYLIAFLIVGRQLDKFTKGEIPYIYTNYAPNMACELTVGLDKYFRDFRKNIGEGKTSVPKLLSKNEILRSIKSINSGYLDGTTPLPLHKIELDEHVKPTSFSHLGGQEVKSGMFTDEVIRLIFPELDSCRPLDVANWIVQFSKYLWSKEWWTSSLLQTFANGGNTPLVSFINTVSTIGAMCRKPSYIYKGYEIMFGLSTDISLNNEHELTGSEMSSLMNATARIWLQLVELYSNLAPMEVAKTLVPSHVYNYNLLNVDSSFPSDDWISQINNVTRAINAKTSKEVKFAPYGDFHVHLPKDFVKLIENIDLNPSPIATSAKLDITSVHVYCDGHGKGMWIRLYGDAGVGPIVYWAPDHPMLDNLVSIQFSIVLSAILSALWHDLRCQGEKTIPAVKAKRSSTRPRGKRRKRHRHRSSTSKSSIRRLPRHISPNQEYVISGHREWGRAEERDNIRMLMHSVSGHRRTMRHVIKNRKDGAEEEAFNAGIILMPNQTYVSPHAKGKENNEGTDERKTTVIVSKGLATLMTFFVKEKEKND